MRAIRRVTAFVVSLMVIQLTLATSGYACVAQADVAADPHDAMVMGNEHPSISSAASHQADSASCDAVPPGGACDDTDTQGDCEAMGVCAPLVLNAEGFAASPVGLWSVIVSAHVPAPLTRATAPESPPPRV